MLLQLIITLALFKCNFGILSYSLLFLPTHKNTRLTEEGFRGMKVRWDEMRWDEIYFLAYFTDKGEMLYVTIYVSDNFVN
jgi:hypothetical protein